jgi:hypothetical protein
MTERRDADAGGAGQQGKTRLCNELDALSRTARESGDWPGWLSSYESQCFGVGV